MSYGMDPCNRAPSYHHAPSPYRAPLPYREPSPNTLAQSLLPTTNGQITYTTSIGPDGKTVYDPFNYQTSNSVVSGIQWIPAKATHILPINAIPTHQEFQQSWQRRASERDREREREREWSAILQRPVSPYHGGGQLGQRPVSPYHGGGVLPSTKPVSPYHSGGALPSNKPSSPYHSGGVLPNTNKAVSPYHSGGSLTGAHYSNPNYGPAYNEAEKRMGDLAIGGKASEYHSRKKSRPAPGSDYPPYSQPPPLEGEVIMPANESFSRPPNMAQSYNYFENFKVQDMDDLTESMPRMPLVLVIHDVYHQDWNRFMQDLSDVWLGRYPIPESAKQDGHPPKRLVVATDLVELWNAAFFNPRGVELLIYRGHERMTGKYIGRVDTDVPGFNITDEDITDSSSELTEGDSEDDYVPPAAARYGNFGGVYGRQDATAIEGREVRLRRKDIEMEERKKRKGKMIKRQLRGLEMTYTLHLHCLPTPGYA